MTHAEQRREARKHGCLEHVRVGDWIKWNDGRTIGRVTSASACQVASFTKRFWRNGKPVERYSSRGSGAVPATPEEAEANRLARLQAEADEKRKDDLAKQVQASREADPYWRAAWKLSIMDDEQLANALRTTITPEQAMAIASK